MSILAMLRLASTTASTPVARRIHVDRTRVARTPVASSSVDSSTPVADIIGCSVLPARAVIARDSTADRARNSCCSERRP